MLWFYIFGKVSYSNEEMQSITLYFFLCSQKFINVLFSFLSLSFLKGHKITLAVVFILMNITQDKTGSSSLGIAYECIENHWRKWPR